MGIYVEIRIRAPLDGLWRHTQDPALHERWDLRFTDIDYLPCREGEPQRFRYETRIGLGLRIRGEGESTGERDERDGQRTSVLKFWSGDGKSLIREGGGYWRYVPTDDGIRFLTWYDYRTRFGPLGRWVDRLLFRPLMGWATAWSFDRLRLWLEQGIHPELSLRRSLSHAVARLALVVVFLYQGLVPKLLGRHASELAMLRDAGLGPGAAEHALTTLGVIEIALGAVLLARWRARWPFALVLALMPVALLGVALSSPQTLGAAFNPVSLNVAVAALAAIGWLSGSDLPSASRCLRTRPEEAGTDRQPT